jgi:hypothetical protein
MTMRQVLAISAVAVSALAGGAAQAGVVITAETTPSGGATRSSSMLLETDRLRETSGHSELIYRADLDKFWTLNVPEHSYNEMTRDSMKEMRAQMDAAMQQTRQQMQSLPEAQRKPMEAMLAQREQPTPQQVRYETSGPARKVGSWSCTPYRVSVNGEQHEELCLVRMSEVGLKRDDVKVFASFGSFIQEIAPPGQGGNRTMAFDFDAISKAVGFDAFPVESTSYESDGKVSSRTTIKAIERKSIAAATFEVPQGYTKKEMTPKGRHAD